MTCVSGYWRVANKHDDKYMEWFKNSLKINCPYVFFCDKETVSMIQSYRQHLPTYYVICHIHDFEMYKYKDKMISDSTHCPSIELNLIWNEKIFLIKKASELNPFSSEFFCWVDAGICTFRNDTPPIESFPNLYKLDQLPTNKFIYSSSNPYHEEEVRTNHYYHHISGTYILHKSIIHDFVNLYQQYLDKLLDKNNIWTDQVILTHIYKDYKHIFYELCRGYGACIVCMY